MIVKFKGGVDSTEQLNILQQYGLEEERVFSFIGVSVLRLLNKERNVAELVELLNKEDQIIEYAEPDYDLNANQLPTDSRFGDLWGLNNTGQNAGLADADIDAVEAWDITTGSSDIVVAVIDTGVDYNHPDLTANMWINTLEQAGTTGVDDDGNGYIDDIYGWDARNDNGDPMDGNNHGTHCAGTIGASANDGGVVGVNWNVKIMALKFLSDRGSGSSTDAIEALEYAITMKNRGVNIKLTNNSWGGGGSSQAMKAAIDASGSAGMLFIAAAGNSGTNNDITPHYPSSYTSSNIIAVAATDRSDELASFSCYGVNSVDLAAPGKHIMSTVVGGGYSSFSGTSMATPHVAGAAALLWAASPSLSASDIKNILLSEIDPLTSLAGKVATGGRLNINNAVRCSSGGGASFTLSPSLADSFTLDMPGTTTITANVSNCGAVTGATVTASLSTGGSLTLLDNGTTPDTQANDGIYTVDWTPTVAGATTVTFSATSGSDSATVTRSGNIVERFAYDVDANYAYSWRNISSTGTRLTMRDDNYAYPISFDFDFYGENFTQLSVASNGTVYFENRYLGYQNKTIPSTNSYSVHKFIAPLWDDLNPATGGAVYYEIQGTAPNRELIVQWHNVPRYPSVGDASFQVILNEAVGSILMQYRDIDFGNAAYNGGRSATVGLQQTQSWGQQYSYNQANLAASQAIMWTVPGGSTPPPTTPPPVTPPPTTPPPTTLPTFNLLHDQWVQISLPDAPPEFANTVSTVLGDDFGSATYAIQWKLLSYDSTTNAYVQLALTDVMERGKGYWIVQYTGSTVTLDLGLLPPPPAAPTVVSCPPTAQRCVEVPLPANGGWGMIGNPFPTAINWSEVMVVTDTGACVAGCTPDQAMSAGIMYNIGYHYNGTAYDTIFGSTNIEPWSGFWAATMSNAAGTNPRLLVPQY